jgi:hypothetical protein
LTALRYVSKRAGLQSASIIEINKMSVEIREITLTSAQIDDTNDEELQVVGYEAEVDHLCWNQDAPVSSGVQSLPDTVENGCDSPINENCRCVSL